jgi:uncharacterized protein YbbC (DUF1343 family)
MWLLACSGAGGDKGQVRPGIDVLITDSLHLLAGSRVGLLTNQTGTGRQGTSDIELLLGAGVRLTVIFSPEHGFRGVLNQSSIGHSVDEATGLPIYSLYGEVRAPTAEMLSQIDVLVVDLQDIGARTYTYISTTLLAMRAAVETQLPVVVADRPNPIGGRAVQGPVLSLPFSSFVGMLPVPLRHGMTLGELALFGNDALQIGAALTVIPADGWHRDLWFDNSGLPWVRPSPSMPDLESATHYPGIVLFEATNLSVGRGTPVAFQVVGAPWLDPREIVETVGPLPGVSLADTVVTPVDPPDGKYGGQVLPSLKLRVTDRTTYDPTRTAVAVLAAVKAFHPDSLEIRSRRLDERAGTDAIRLALDDAAPASEVWASWEAALAEFRQARQRYLLYP